MSELTTRSLPTAIWWNPFTVERIRFRTSLSLDECIQRIRAHTYSFWDAAEPGPTLPFAGTIESNRFTLYRNPIRIILGIPFVPRNDFRPIVQGVIMPDAADGTIVSIRLCWHIYVRIFLAVLVISLSLAILLSFLEAAGVVAIDPSLSDPLLVLLIAMIGGGLFYFPLVIASWFTRRQRVFLVETMQKTLQAPGLQQIK